MLIIIHTQNSHSRVATTKSYHNGPSKRGGEGLSLQSQEVQDLCGSASVDQLMFNTCSEHYTVDLTNKCTMVTKDFLRDFPHGFTGSVEQEDRTFDIQLEVNT